MIVNPYPLSISTNLSYAVLFVIKFKLKYSPPRNFECEILFLLYCFFLFHPVNKIILKQYDKLFKNVLTVLFCYRNLATVIQ